MKSPSGSLLKLPTKATVELAFTTWSCPALAIGESLDIDSAALFACAASWEFTGGVKGGDIGAVKGGWIAALLVGILTVFEPLFWLIDRMLVLAEGDFMI